MSSTTVLCFGDSWTHGNSIALTSHLRNHDNVRVISEDYWGSTAEYFANYSHLLPEAVTKYKADYVLLSLGGNDFKNIYWRQKRYIAPWKAVEEIEGNTRKVLDSLYALHPNVKVVVYGYDFPGDIAGVVTGAIWGRSSKDMSNTTKMLLFLYNYVGVRLINSSIMRIGSMYERLSKIYSKSNNTLTYVPLWGTLQQAEIKDEKTKLAIKMGYPSPTKFMDDPIHANYDGFTHLLEKLYHSYFKSELTPLSPIASVVSPSEVTITA